MRKLIVLLLAISLVLLVSCSSKFPNLTDPTKGIVAISIEASNRTGMGFYRYFSIYPHLHPNYEIIIYPTSGKNFAFSPEMASGEYNFNRIKNIPWDRAANTIGGYKSSEQKLSYGMHLDVVPGAVTILDQKLMVELIPYEEGLSGDKSFTMNAGLSRISEDEMEDLIEEFKRIDIDGQWKIANTISSPIISSIKTNPEELKAIAKQGNPEAQYRLAMMYLEDAEIRDHREASLWLNKAAKQGHAEACDSLGGMVFDDSIVKDETGDVQKYNNSDEHGHVLAQHEKALRDHKGAIVSQDYQESLNKNKSIMKEHQHSIAIATGSWRGLYYHSGNAICNIINNNFKYHGIKCNPIPHESSVKRIWAILNHEYDFGIVQSDHLRNTWEGIPGWGDNWGTQKEIRTVFAITVRYKDNDTFANKPILITSAQLSDEVVYKLTKEVFEFIDNFRKEYTACKFLDKQDMLDLLVAPIHPGAMRYYEEVGLK